MHEAKNVIISVLCQPERESKTGTPEGRAVRRILRGRKVRPREERELDRYRHGLSISIQQEGEDETRQ